MYSTRWSPGLRQGDIVGPIFFPVLGSQFTMVTQARSLAESGGTQSVQLLQIPGDQRFAVIASHDCEFNSGKRNKLLVARLEDVPGNLSDEELTELRLSNDVRSRAESDRNIAGVNSFLLAPLPSHFDSEQIAVFTTITPLPMKMYDDLLRMKKAELTHEVRVLFREKLAWFFGRPADDIEEDVKRQAATT